MYVNNEVSILVHIRRTFEISAEGEIPFMQSSQTCKRKWNVPETHFATLIKLPLLFPVFITRHSILQLVSNQLQEIRFLHDAESINGSHNARLGPHRFAQGQAQGAGPAQPQGREPGAPIRRGGAYCEEVRRRFEPEGWRSGCEPEEAGGGDGASSAGARSGGGPARDPEGAFGEEDEPGGAGEADQRADAGGAGVRKWQGSA